MRNLAVAVMLLPMLLTSCVDAPKPVTKYSPIAIIPNQCVTDYIRQASDMPDCAVDWLDKITIQQTRLKQNEEEAQR